MGTSVSRPDLTNEDHVFRAKHARKPHIAADHVGKVEIDCIYTRDNCETGEKDARTFGENSCKGKFAQSAPELLALCLQKCGKIDNPKPADDCTEELKK